MYFYPPNLGPTGLSASIWASFMTKISPKWLVDGAKLQISCETTKKGAEKMYEPRKRMYENDNLKLNANPKLNEDEDENEGYK